MLVYRAPRQRVGVIEGFKLVRKDGTTHNGYRWPLPMPGERVRVEATDPTEHNSPCPKHEGDGLCVALTCVGAQSGGIRVVDAIGLLLEYDEADVLAEDTNKRRVRAVTVTGIFDPVELVRAGLCSDLYQANLTGANLARADLTGADLTGAILTGTNLFGANLAGANLARAYLTGADLTGADLTGVSLARTYLTGADLTCANLTGANLFGANLYKANLAKAHLVRANLYEANLYGADLYGADLAGADLAGADLVAANLFGVRNDPGGGIR